LPDTIDTATVAVKDYAKEQKDIASKSDAILFSVMSSVRAKKKYGDFTAEDIIEVLSRLYEGTESFVKLKRKLKI